MNPTEPTGFAVAPTDRLDRHRDRFAQLLVVLIVVFVLSGIEGHPVVRVFSAAAHLVAVVVAASTTGVPRRFQPKVFIGGLLTLGAIATILIAVGGDTLMGVGFLFSAMTVGGLLAIVLNRILNHHDVQMQTIAGAMCAYLLFGMFFAAVFATMDLLQPHHVFNHHMALPDYEYFSVSTLTTVGYGDITAVTGLARRLAMLEAITGQMFLATAVARLMSVARFDRRRTELDNETS